MKELTSENFEQTIKENRIVVVEFWAEWCGSCKAFGELLEKAQADFPDVLFAKINADKEFELATQFLITGLPSTICFLDGEVYAQDYGALPVHRIRSMIPEYQV